MDGAGDDECSDDDGDDLVVVKKWIAFEGAKGIGRIRLSDGTLEERPRTPAGPRASSSAISCVRSSATPSSPTVSSLVTASASLSHPRRPRMPTPLLQIFNT